MKTTTKILPLIFAILATCSQHAVAQIQVYDFTTIAGTAGVQGSADGTNHSAHFTVPASVSVDAHGNLFVADSGNGTIRKLTPSGTNWVSVTIAGSAGVAGTLDGTNGAIQFLEAASAAVDAAGNVYVADQTANTIRKLVQNGTNWVSTTIAGLAGIPGSLDGTNILARFLRPASVTVNAAGTVFVADSGNFTIRKIELTGTNYVTTTIAGQAGVSGVADGTNNTALFVSPNSVTVDSSGNLYVADFPALPNTNGLSRIRKLVQQGTNWVVTTLAMVPPDIGGSFGVAVGANGTVYAADTHGNTIRELIASGTNRVWTILAGLTNTAGSVDGTNLLSRFNAPASVAIDASANLYVADSLNATVRLGLNVGTAPAPVILNLNPGSTSVSLTWSSTAGLHYQPQSATSLTATNWVDVGASVTATNATASANDSTGVQAQQRFYRILMRP